MPAEARFPAMGGEAHVVVVGGDGRQLEAARRRIADLEARWSRFLPDSELSRLNRCPDQAVEVSPETFSLVEHAVTGWFETGGRYDPTVLRALCAAGYDRDLALVVTEVPRLLGASDDQPGEPLIAPGCEHIELDTSRSTILLPAGVGIDPGGIGKGLAADLVTGELIDAGAEGALVSLGGDLRVRGVPPVGETWSIAVDDPFDPTRRLFTVGLHDGGVATSSRLRRRWLHNGRPNHHIIDPRSGEPTTGDLVAATAVASEAWWAEAVTKSVLVAGVPAARADAPGALVATVDAQGHADLSPTLARIAA
jgi:thiamine biosynthesis lipoprotein